MRNIKESKIKKSKAKKQKINRTKLNEPSFKPDVIEEDFCTLFSKEWTKNAAKITGLMRNPRSITGSLLTGFAHRYYVRSFRPLKTKKLRRCSVRRVASPCSGARRNRWGMGDWDAHRAARLGGGLYFQIIGHDISGFTLFKTQLIAKCILWFVIFTMGHLDWFPNEKFRQNNFRTLQSFLLSTKYIYEKLG